MNKTALIFGGVGAAGLIALAFFKGKAAGEGDGTTSDDTPDDAKKEIVKKDLTYPQSWYSTAADGMEAKLREVYKLQFYGMKNLYREGFDAREYILDKFKSLKTKSDWLQLVAKFDRRYNILIQTLEKSNLVQWLNYYAPGCTWTVKDAGGKPVTMNLMFMIRFWLRENTGIKI